MLSIASNAPPKPGKVLPESLTPQSRLIKDSERSPIWASVPKRSPRINKRNKEKDGKKLMQAKETRTLKSRPPNVPSTVLLGLIRGIRLCLPSLVPII